MRTQLAAIAATQGGLFTRAQARAAGYGLPEIRGLTAPGGAWVVVRRGVYVDRALWNDLESHRERPLALARAVHLSLGVEHVLSHDSAAYAWGLPILRPREPMVHVTRQRVQGTRTEHGVKHHLVRRLEGPYVAEGLPVTSLARTALDIAREHGRLAGLVACDAALRFGATHADFDEVLASMWSWRHVNRARAAAHDAVLGAESPGETLARDLAIEAGLGDGIITQFPVEITNGIAWCDLLVGCHVIEFDGRKKYELSSDGGFAGESPAAVVWREKVRERDVNGRRLGVSRVFWDDCLGPGRRTALERLAREHDDVCRRYGTEPPPDVIAFAHRMWAARQARLERDFREVELFRASSISA